MTRRAERRRADIQRQLLLGPALLSDLARALGRWRLTVYPDLCALEEAGAVVTEWVRLPGCPDGAVAATYRLPTAVEQDASAVWQEALERRVRAVLHWYGDSVEPGDGSAW